MHITMLQAAQEAANRERQAYRRYQLAENSLRHGRVTAADRDLYFRHWQEAQQAADNLRARALRGI